MVCFYIRLGMGAGRAAAVFNHGSHAGLKFVGRQACHPHPICRECISCQLASVAMNPAFIRPVQDTFATFLSFLGTRPT